MCNTTISSVNHVIDMSRIASNCQTQANTSQSTSSHHSSSARLSGKAACHSGGAASRQSSVTMQLQQYTRTSGGASNSKTVSTLTFSQTTSNAGSSGSGRPSGFHVALPHHPAWKAGFDRLPPQLPTSNQRPGLDRNDCERRGNGRMGGQPGWTSTQSGNKASIDLGNYTLDLNKSNSSMLLTNKQTGDTTRVWGDPHIDTNGMSATFNGPVTFNLPDRTKITVGTQAKGSVSYADQLTITNGNRAYTVSGLSQADKSPLSIQTSGNGRQLDRATPDGYSLVASRSGTGWIDPLTGRAPTAEDFSRA